MPQVQKIQDSVKYQEPISPISLKASDMVKEAQANKRKAKELVKEAEKLLADARMPLKQDWQKYNKGYFENISTLYRNAMVLDPSHKAEIQNQWTKLLIESGVHNSKTISGWTSGQTNEYRLKNFGIMFMDLALEFDPNCKKKIHDALIKVGHEAAATPKGLDLNRLNEWNRRSKDAKLYYEAAKRYE